MKKAIWIIITLILSGLIPAGVAIMLKYNDLCSASKKARFGEDLIQSIELASQASDLIPFLPQADREIQRSFSVLTNNPARILPNLTDGDVWPEVKPLLADLHERLAPVIEPETFESVKSAIAEGICKETAARTEAAIDAKQLDRSIFGLATLIEFNVGIEELFPRFVEMAQDHKDLPLKTFKNICQLQSTLPLEQRDSAQWKSLLDRLSKYFALNTAVAVTTNTRDVSVQPLRRLKKDLSDDLAGYCSPEQTKMIFDYAVGQIKEISEREASAAYDEKDLSALAVKLSLLINLDYGETASEKEAIDRWLNSYAIWLKEEKYRETHILIESLKSNIPASFQPTPGGKLIDAILLICEQKHGIKYSGEATVTQAFEKAGFIVFSATSDKPIAAFKLTAPQVMHGLPSHYSSNGYGTTTATRCPATATLSGVIVNSEEKQVKRISVSNTEPAPRSISYRSSSASSSVDRSGSPTQKTIDSNAKKGLMRKMEAEIIRQAPDIRL